MEEGDGPISHGICGPCAEDVKKEHEYFKDIKKKVEEEINGKTSRKTVNQKG